MPANLNALIRYKQIDLCLKNPYLKATIEVMQEKCSDQLAEHRGIYKQISERTIRDDIRVMRSDAMGFNAPIVVHHGVYSYEDKDYSIFSTSISEMDLLKEVVNLLIQERVNIKSAKLNVLLKELSGITGIRIYEEKKEDGLFTENTQDFKLKNNEIDPIHIKKTSKRKSKIKPKEEKGLNTKYLKLQNPIRTGRSIDLSQFHRSSKSIKKKVVSHIYSWESILEVL